MATGADTDMITINANYARSAGNVLTTQGSTRTLDHEIPLSIVDLIVPRPQPGASSLPVGGTISGSYDADISFERGDLSSERTVAMEFEVNFDENPSEQVLESEKGQWSMDLESGEVK